MYYDDNDFENYYEQTRADEIFEEAMEKFQEILKEDVRTNINYTYEENIRLKKENEVLKSRIRDLDSKERDLNNREKQLASTSESTFHRKKFSDILKPLEEQLDMWYVRSISELIPKCDLCDDGRQIDYKSVNGKIIKGECDCCKYHTVYRIAHTNIKHLSFYKSDRDRNFILTPKYESKDYDDTYFKLNIQQLIKEFVIDEVSKYDCYSSYSGFTGFCTEEECQKYCDYLNSQIK